MIRVATYNVSGSADRDAVASVLRGLGADVVGLTESPGRLGLAGLARRAGLSVAARAGRGTTRVAVLVGERARVLSTQRHRLQAPGGAPDRAAVHAIVGVGGMRLSVLVTQLGLRPEVRLDHVHQLEAILANVEAAPVLLGDLNEAPGGAAVERLDEVLVDAWTVAGDGSGLTYPTPDPAVRQDYVWCGAELTVVEARVVADPPADVASHHRPVVVGFADARSDRTTDALPGGVVADVEDAEPAA